MPKSVLTRAHHLLRRRRFSNAIRLLENQIFRYRNNAKFYSLLGSACLYTGDFGGAESYLRRCEQLNSDDIPALLGLAAIEFKRGQTEAALKIWLKVIDLDPGNRSANHALNTLRKNSVWEGSEVRVDSLRLPSILPPLPSSPWLWWAPILLVLVLAAIFCGYFLILPAVQAKRLLRPGVAEVQLTGTQSLIAGQLTPAEGEGAGSESSEVSFVFTEKQIDENFQGIKDYLLEYRDNLAIREINRLLLSNASAYVKEKARLMKTFVEQPDFSTVKDTFSYLEVIENPELYRDSYVVWSGKAANLRVGEEAITFDLLVGYEQEKELLGLVPVTLDFAAELSNGDGVEVLARVNIDNGLLSLSGVSIHRLYRSP
jgi:tetratricopeptide (TPR) repeat protein